MSSHAEPTTAEKLRGLRWNTIADAANTVFVQFTYFGSIFILFLSELGLGTSQIGFMLSLFPFAGLIAPLIAPWVARVGYKRIFLSFWALRKVITAGLLLVPLVLMQFGQTLTLIFVGLIVGGFALCRAIAETGKYPWSQEYIPNSVRGKYAAVNNVFMTITGLIAVAIGGFVLERGTGLAPYMWLITVGLLCGLVGFWAFAHIPGGAPSIEYQKEDRPPRALWVAAKDRNFRNYLIGIALMTLAMTPMTSFLPLFMREQVGLSDSQVVMLQNGSMIGGLISVYMWGWAADRFGSTPVMLTGIVSRLLLPILWLIMPRFSELSLEAALGIAFLQGITGMGWAIGSARLLFVSVVPPEKKADYLALYYAWIGLVGGLSQLIGGWILYWTRDLSGNFAGVPIDPYTPLFLLGLGLPLIGLAVLRRIHIDNEVGMVQFADILLRGHPLWAVESMIRFRMAKEEEAVVISTEKLGQAKSLLTVEELLESLQDPRFNVRFEAIVAIGRSRHDDRLINALATMLHDNDPALSVMSAWALGRIGSPAGQEPLRQALDSDYRSIRAHSARSLATLKDESVIDTLRWRLQRETDHGLQVAYAASLGQLHDTTAVPLILELLATERESLMRAELALALARLVGNEGEFVILLRQLRTDMLTTILQTLATLQKRMSDVDTVLAATDAFSQNEQTRGVALLCQLAETLPDDMPLEDSVLHATCAQLQVGVAERLETFALMLHLLLNRLGK